MASEYRPPRRIEGGRAVEVFSHGEWRPATQDMWHWDWIDDRWLAHCVWYEPGFSGEASLPAELVRLPIEDES